MKLILWQLYLPKVISIKRDNFGNFQIHHLVFRNFSESCQNIYLEVLNICKITWHIMYIGCSNGQWHQSWNVKYWWWSVVTVNIKEDVGFMQIKHFLRLNCDLCHKHIKIFKGKNWILVIFQLMLPRIWFWFECIDQFCLKYMVKCEGLLNTDLAEMLFTEHTSPFHEDLMWRWICTIWKMVPSACKQIFCQIRSFW